VGGGEGGCRRVGCGRCQALCRQQPGCCAGLRETGVPPEALSGGDRWASGPAHAHGARRRASSASSSDAAAHLASDALRVVQRAGAGAAAPATRRVQLGCQHEVGHRAVPAAGARQPRRHAGGVAVLGAGVAAAGRGQLPAWRGRGGLAGQGNRAEGRRGRGGGGREVQGASQARSGGRTALPALSGPQRCCGAHRCHRVQDPSDGSSSSSSSSAPEGVGAGQVAVPPPCSRPCRPCRRRRLRRRVGAAGVHAVAVAVRGRAAAGRACSGRVRPLVLLRRGRGCGGWGEWKGWELGRGQGLAGCLSRQQSVARQAARAGGRRSEAWQAGAAPVPLQLGTSCRFWFLARPPWPAQPAAAAGEGAARCGSAHPPPVSVSR
jgi:hypothetical protein